MKRRATRFEFGSVHKINHSPAILRFPKCLFGEPFADKPLRIAAAGALLGRSLLIESLHSMITAGKPGKYD